MPGLTRDRLTPKRAGSTLVADPIAAGTTLFTGGMYTLDAAGNAKPSVAADKKPVRAVCTVHAVEADGDSAKGERGIFCFENSTGAAEVKRADIGANAYVADDHTVAKTGSSIAGEIVDLDDMGVWVNVGFAAVPTTA